MKVKTVYAVVPRHITDGNVSISCGHITRCVTHEQAVKVATDLLGKRPYDGMVIYQAVTLVSRSAPPIEVIPLGEHACDKEL